MRCFKLLGERVMVREFELQIAELLGRAAILNRFTRSGIPTAMAVTMPQFRKRLGNYAFR
jgi:hypothetical protein